VPDVHKGGTQERGGHENELYSRHKQRKHLHLLRDDTNSLIVGMHYHHFKNQKHNLGILELFIPPVLGTLTSENCSSTT
jgi:hypothetical protein